MSHPMTLVRGPCGCRVNLRYIFFEGRHVFTVYIPVAPMDERHEGRLTMLDILHARPDTMVGFCSI